ncbi:branched-chain amino acid ABC transporter permease [Candidatus Peregrinibacteria bacterium CG_4_10_14_0_2_um_filter_41_8]|nr:MAG: branched-chain amino acid ABC transporter permease [Candidatus Peregrinibacteria bacterium CG_4_10_14_0_2_um_filter_41_8]
MDFIVQLAIYSAIASIAAVSLNYVVGFTGIMSISHASFYGIGAYGTALLLTKTGLSFVPALLLGGVITGLVAALASVPILRLREDSLMLVSVGFALIIHSLMLNWQSLTNGPRGVKSIPRPEIFGISLTDKNFYLVLCLVLLVLTIIIFYKITKSPYGTVIKGIRENEEVMKNYGYNVSKYKHSVFVLGAIFAGLAGGLFASYIQYISPESFILLPSVFMLIMVILGGMGSIGGSIIGAILITVIPELMRFAGLPSSFAAESNQIVYGIILFALMYWRPQGLFGKYKI